MSDICERLVRFAGKVCLSTDTEVEAAIEIERLRAEIATLRAANETHKEIAVRETMNVATLRSALKPFADIAKQTEHWSGPPVSVPLYVIRAAAAALKENNK